MSANSSELFPFLTEGIEIHLHPKGGTLFFNGSPMKLGIYSADFASLCNGKNKVKEILSTLKTTDLQALEIVNFIASAIESGWLGLSEKPTNSQLRVTGSRTAFYPPHMAIELTEACNLICSYCYRESEFNKQGNMSAETLLKLLEKLWSLGLRSVELTGGEPLLNQDFEKILDFCLDKFFLTGLLTNGTLLSEKFDDKLIEAKDKFILSVSLDASTPDIHDARRGVPGSFNKTVSNIKRLADLGISVRVSMVVDDNNFSEIENTLLLAKKLGAIAFSYSPVLPFGRAKEGYSNKWRMDAKEVERIEKRLFETYGGFLTELSEENINDVAGEYGCGAGYRSFTMDPWGNIRPCTTYGTKELVFGNLLTQSPEQVFSHPAIFAMSDLKTPSTMFCSECNQSYFCRYCSLRGLHRSQNESNCNWKKQKAFEIIESFWNKPE